MRRLVVGGLMAILAMTTGAQASSMAFMDLGATTSTGRGLHTYQYFPDMSPDGTVIGASTSGSAGFVAVNGVKTTISTGSVTGVSKIGGVPTAVGKMATGSSAGYWQNGSWTALPLDGTTAWTPTDIGVKADGTDWWAVGYKGNGQTSGYNPVKYTNSSNTTGEVTRPSQADWGLPTGVSNTGTFVNYALYRSGATARNSYFNNGTTQTWLPAIQGPAGTSLEVYTNNISSDGNVKVGWSWANAGNYWQATWWDSGNAAHAIPIDLTNPAWTEEAYSVDGDGTVIGGRESDSSNEIDGKAWIYDVTAGTKTFVSAFLAGKGVDTTGWVFNNVTGISDDGLSFVGTGRHDGVYSVWAYSVVPEPATLTLLALGGLFLRRRR